jgi:hypothetical protein
MEYLLLNEEEFSRLNLGQKEHLLWNSVQRLDAGEPPPMVAMDIISKNILTKNDLKQFKLWLKKYKKQKPPSILAPLGKRGKL